MNVNAYILLGDPRWIRESICSYYPLVQRIVALADDNSRGWDENPLPVEQCVDLLREVDPLKKLEVIRAPIVHPGLHPMVMDTAARQLALDAASADDPDWVLQFDTDEIVTAPGTLARVLATAAAKGADAIDYPSRWILGRADTKWRRDRYLEASDALWRVAAHYPGPVAVRPHTRLNYSRRAIGVYYRVDFRRFNTYHEYTRLHPVHETVSPREGILHLSWVDRQSREAKSERRHGHHEDHDLTTFAAQRRWRLAHPLLAVASTPLRAGHGHPNRLRMVRLHLGDGRPRFRR